MSFTYGVYEIQANSVGSSKVFRSQQLPAKYTSAAEWFPKEPRKQRPSTTVDVSHNFAISSEIRNTKSMVSIVRSGQQ